MVVIDNPAAQRFETQVEGQVCVLEYRIRVDSMEFHHTGVPQALGGRGIAAALTRFALDAARARGMHVVPSCSYVAAWIEQHPDYADLVRHDS